MQHFYPPCLLVYKVFWFVCPLELQLLPYISLIRPAINLDEK
jgi:hypothetical protein